jgi:hypothetical protein
VNMIVRAFEGGQNPAAWTIAGGKPTLLHQ